MKKTTAEITQLIELRTAIIAEYGKLRAYRENKNALMKEGDHARALHQIVVRMDFILADYVTFD